MATNGQETLADAFRNNTVHTLFYYSATNAHSIWLLIVYTDVDDWWGENDSLFKSCNTFGISGYYLEYYV